MTPELAWEGQEMDSFRVACLLHDWRSGRPAPSREGAVAVRCNKKGKGPIKGGDSASFSFSSLKSHSVVTCSRLQYACVLQAACSPSPYSAAVVVNRASCGNANRCEEVGVRVGSVAQSLRPRAISHQCNGTKTSTTAKMNTTD